MLLFTQKNSTHYICAICDKTDILKVIFIYRDPPKNDNIVAQYEHSKDKLDTIISDLVKTNWIKSFIPDIIIKNKDFEHRIGLDDIFLN